jgi:hypothetical protein
MNILAYDLYRVVFLRKDGSNRESFLHRALKGIWAFHAGCYMQDRARELPHRKKAVVLSKGQSEALGGFFYYHIDCPDGGGYFTVGSDGENVVVRSFCESDHPGAGAEDCLYIDGSPLGRRQTLTVPRDAEVAYIDYVDKHKRSDDWVKAVIQVVPILISLPG